MQLHHKKWLALLFIFPLLINVAVAQTDNNSRFPAEKHIKTAKQEMSEHTDDLRALMLTLYNLNPGELAKSTQVGEREMTEWVFDGKANWKFDGIRRQQGTPAIALVFDPDFTGDHVLALVVGIETLLFDAYGATNEFDIPAMQDQQKQRQARCELQGLLQKIASQPAAGKQSAMLAQSHSIQEIQNTLRTIIKRINAKSDKKTDLACPH
ncbi:MAG: hypothetical protein ACAH08_09995 [Methylophilus sp.]